MTIGSISVLFVANLWKKLIVWADVCEMCTGLWIGSAYLPGALAALHSP